ncbi:LysR family transcriptional regulator [Corynebacterium halotolerans]|uniref:LysR family transcriptional regulator n=1 Tax=Corynebacterium halotolerans YIM 70093 = DSM 44683 TaxID=1121362 RepID=M1NVS2_9CORY|nr:LysR family transcriptional regulator [Corynebacterium halotolerans]AGF71590.1 LysR family transcriptional regulator [Corynebacterium halotolerans YIM 70093 = DSM 44683]
MNNFRELPTSSRTFGVNLATVDLNLLVSLHAILEERSVTGAADRVGLSQPAMSHALRRIRKLFGDEILIRQGVHSVLTPRAQGLLGPLRELLHRASRLLGGEAFDPERSQRTVTIAMSPTMAYILGRAVTHLLEEEAPRMGLRIIATTDTSDAVFLEQGADVLLLAEGYETEHPRQRLFDDEWVVIGGTPELLEGDVISRLQDWPHVALDSERLTRPYEVLRHRGVDVKVQVRVNDYLLLPQFVAGVRKIGLHRRRAVERMTHNHPLYIADFPFPLLGLGVDTVWNPWLGDAAFREWLRDLLLRACDMQWPNNED